MKTNANIDASYVTMSQRDSSGAASPSCCLPVLLCFFPLGQGVLFKKSVFPTAWQHLHALQWPFAQPECQLLLV